MVYVKEVKTQEDYKLLLTFENGEKKIFDCSNLLKYKINKPLTNKSFFSSAYVKHGTVVWNEKIDIAPEQLYDESVPV
ncbi:MAG: DUF2442 domain-containing protein [Treponema sp.]|nr:DUF2442 domain-containing protein [Treponema sp.]